MPVTVQARPHAWIHAHRSLASAGTWLARAAAVQSAAADSNADAIKQLLTRRSYVPPRVLGPIQLVRIPGRCP
jgi:hypothetical protein